MGVNFKFNTGGFAEGSSTATGNYSHAEGFGTIASGVSSHAEGAKYENNRNTESAGLASHAEGASTYAKADGSHAEGILNIAGRFSNEISTAAQELGISGTPQELAAKLLGYGAHVEGMNNKALGSCSHAEGNATKALANSTHAEGDTTIASGEASHAEGYNTQAKGNQSHAEGSNTVAIGNSSHTEGTSTTASGSFSHAEGSHTEASGRDSHAEGAYNKAIGIASHAEGDNNIAPNEAQHVSGKYATIDNTGTAIFQVGIGNDAGDRKDALRIKTDGDIIIQQDNQEIVLQDKLDSLQKQIDGETSSWLFEGKPTTTNKPANEWTTDELKQRHEGDTYTNINNATNEHLDNPDIWENGSSTSESGKSYDAVKTGLTTRIRTKELLRNNKSPKKIKVVAGYSVVIRYFNKNKIQTTGSNDTWLSEFTLNPKYPYFALVFRKNDNSNITIDVLKSFTQSIFTIEGAFDYDPTAGQSWRWCNVDDEYGTGWHWHKIADSDAVKALTIANRVREDFDNLEIGGVNLLPNTRTGVGFTFQPLSTGCSGEFDSTNKWFKFTCPQNAVTTSLIDTILLKSPTVLLTPGTYTVSCLYRCTLPLNRMQVLCLPVTSEGAYDMDTLSFAFEIKSSNPVTYFKKYSATFTISEDLRDVYGWIIRIDLDHRGSHGNSQELYVKDIKLEKGHKATDWTPTLSEFTTDLSGYLRLSGGTMTGAIDFEWNGPDIHNMLTWRKQGILLLDETTNNNKLYLGTAAQLPLTVHKLTTNGNILPSTSAPLIGTMVAIQPGEPRPTYISLGSTDAYFNKIYAREFKGLADNALKLYTYGTGFQSQLEPLAVNVGDASKPVYFKDGVPVACNGTLPTNQQITNWNLAYGWGDHSEAGYVKKAGDTMIGALHAPAFYETSDIRKKDIKSDLSLDKCYDLIDKCQTVIYSLKDLTQELVGMIAQEIEEFFPEVVATDEEGFKSLAYDRLVVICFKVLKDVIKRLEKLES